jgi:transcriptional regulator with XRE-family HTH domain
MGHEGQATCSSDLGMLLRRYRLAAGISQETLAERVRMTATGIGRIERGERRAPRHETVGRLIKALALTHEQRQAFEAAARRSRSMTRPAGAPVTAGPWPGVDHPKLPLALTSFRGREVELDQIESLLNDYRMVTLTGAGGIGKTQTALRVGTALVQASAGANCYFVNLAPVGSPSLIAAALASRLRRQSACRKCRIAHSLRR